MDWDSQKKSWMLDLPVIFYLGDDEFVWLVDLAVIRARGDITTVFLRVSDHTHRTRFEETFNYGVGKGSFKQILSLQFQKS